MTKPLQLVVLHGGSANIAYLWNACHGTLRNCPLKGYDTDMIVLALQISGLEYVDPLVADNAHPLNQMLQNGTADLDLATSEITYDDYELVALTGAVDKWCYYFLMPLQEPIVIKHTVNFFNTAECDASCKTEEKSQTTMNNQPYSYTEFLLDTFPWIYYVYLTLGIAAISTILTISQRESVRSMLVEWPLRLLAVVLRQPALDHFAKHARLSGLVAAAASLLPFTIFAMYFELNIKLLLAVPFQHRPPVQSTDELIHAMKHGGYKFVMVSYGYWPGLFSTPEQRAELKALTDRFVTYPDTDPYGVLRAISDPALKQVAMTVVSWSTNHCTDTLVSNDDLPYLYVRIKDIAPQSMAYPMRRELYKERERLNRALALIQPAAINFPLKYDSGVFEYSLKLNPKYNNTVRFAQYRLVLVFFGAIYLGCVLVFFLEIIINKMARWLRMWRTMGTTRLLH